MSIKQISTPEDILQLGTILGVWAHPDDESFVAAGVLAMAVRNGQTVVCVTATNGEAGVKDTDRWPMETLGEVRVAELEAAMKVLGIQDHELLNYADGLCTKVDRDEAVGRVRELVKQWRPDSIVTFGPEGLTGHPDHQCVSSWATEAVRTAGWPVRIFHAVHTPEQYEDHLKQLDKQLDIYFNIRKPPLVSVEKCAIACELPTDILALKRQALEVMPSQMEELCALLPTDRFKGAFGGEYFVEA